MNRPSRTDEPEGDGYNQSPNALSNDLTTNEDLNGISNSRVLRDDALALQDTGHGAFEQLPDGDPVRRPDAVRISTGGEPAPGPPVSGRQWPATPDEVGSWRGDRARRLLRRAGNGVVNFGKFVGPGFMVAVSYIDPGNYATDIAAGASYRFRLLFVVLLSNLFAIFLQSLSIKLGTVSGLNLAEACRAFLPRWLNYFLYAMAEAAIIATDLAEVIGTAIALNLLTPKIPLVAGCALSILDVMIILVFYRPGGSMRGLRAFEFFVVLLVLGVVVCFCIQLSLLPDTDVGELFRGYLPSAAIAERQGLYQACGILGATVMPHSLYLGSGIVQARLREYDAKAGNLPEPAEESEEKSTYIPSLAAVRFSLKYSVAELAVSLFTFALFVNSAILVVAGASLFEQPDALGADIFAIHRLLSESLAPAAGTVFALALLLSGISAGIVCTIAGQMVSEGQLNWRLRPWLRRLITRSVSITPSIIVAGAVGRAGLDAALNASQVALSIALPFVTAPLIWFTCRARYMTVRPGGARFAVPGADDARPDIENPETTPHVDAPRTLWSRNMFRCFGSPDDSGCVNMANSWPVAVLAVLIWIVIAVLNVANIVLLAKGA